MCQDLQSIEDSDELRINVSNSTKLDNVTAVVNLYLGWINQCEEVLKQYYENELGDKVYDGWFNDIEIYSVDITINSIEDYGATISCGDQVIKDHILEIDFNKMKVEAIRLNG